MFDRNAKIPRTKLPRKAQNDRPLARCVLGSNTWHSFILWLTVTGIAVPPPTINTTSLVHDLSFIRKGYCSSLAQEAQ
jgi:hypothetical protein